MNFTPIETQLIQEEKIKLISENTNFEDPDVTKLETDIGSASISSSQTSKKRQLVASEDILDINILKSNIAEFE